MQGQTSVNTSMQTCTPRFVFILKKAVFVFFIGNVVFSSHYEPSGNFKSNLVIFACNSSTNPNNIEATFQNIGHTLPGHIVGTSDA